MKIYLFLYFLCTGFVSGVRKLLIFNQEENADSLYNSNNLNYTYYDKYIDHIHKLKIQKMNGIVNIFIYESNDYNWKSTCKTKGFSFGKINNQVIDKSKKGLYYIKLCNNYDNLVKNNNIIFLTKNYDFIDIIHYLIYGKQYNSIYPLYSFINENGITNNYSHDDIILEKYYFIVLYYYYLSIKNIIFLLLVFCFFITVLYNYLIN
jgi:hypothetical protein